MTTDLYVKVRYQDWPERFWVKVRREDGKWIGTVRNNLITPGVPLKFGDEIDMDGGGIDFLDMMTGEQLRTLERMRESYEGGA
jgi:hypothetical protein